MGDLFYIASHDEKGGILLCEIESDGRISPVDRYPQNRVSWLCREGDRLYGLLREPFMQQSGIVGFDIAPDGRLMNEGEIMPTYGSVAAYIAFIGSRLYCANYLSATTVCFPDTVLVHRGRGTDPARQLCGHPHCIAPVPGSDSIVITDLGTDKLYVCSRALEVRQRVDMPSGSGPRHIVFSPDGKYAFCSLEMASAVAVLSVSGAMLKYEYSVKNVPEDFVGTTSAAAIRLSRDGGLLYVSQRGYIGAAVYSVKGGDIRRIGYVNCGEDARIREMNFVGDWLLCGDEKAHNIKVFPRDGCIDAPWVSQFPVTRPWCILPL